MTDQKFITPKLNILIVDDDPNSREILIDCLEGQGYLIVEVNNPQDALMEASNSKDRSGSRHPLRGRSATKSPWGDNRNPLRNQPDPSKV